MARGQLHCGEHKELQRGRGRSGARGTVRDHPRAVEECDMGDAARPAHQPPRAGCAVVSDMFLLCGVC